MVNSFRHSLPRLLGDVRPDEGRPDDVHLRNLYDDRDALQLREERPLRTLRLACDDRQGLLPVPPSRLLGCARQALSDSVSFEKERKTKKTKKKEKRIGFVSGRRKKKTKKTKKKEKRKKESVL